MGQSRADQSFSHRLTYVSALTSQITDRLRLSLERESMLTKSDSKMSVIEIAEVKHMRGM